MRAFLKSKDNLENTPTIDVTGSKSESNRLLLLQALYPNIAIENLSESDDTIVLKKGLEIINGVVDLGHAGTAMRFLTAYFAAKEGAEVILKGSDRMHQRPIKILVDALSALGAKIEYLETEGYPPLRVFGKKIEGGSVKIEANVSSQYISALLLIAPSFPKGLELELKGSITSVPYIEMTLSLLKQIGVESTFLENLIKIEPLAKSLNTTFVVESDWSSASYFYSLIALSKASSAILKRYSEDSLQGDAALVSIYKLLGVETVFNASEYSITLSKRKDHVSDFLSLDLTNTPDIAQTIAVTCFGLGIGCKLIGLHTLKIKETDRLSALKTELEKLGAIVTLTSNSLELDSLSITGSSETYKKNILIETYHDHRMAMAFAPLAVRFPISVNNPMVVAKSFPTFWEDLATMGVEIGFQ